GRWLVVHPPDLDGDYDVPAALAAAGADLVRVAVSGPGQDRESLAELVRAAVAERSVTGVLSLLADEDRPHPDHPDVPGGAALTLALVQALGDAGVQAPLWCITRSLAVIGFGERAGAAAQAAVAGLGRTVALEYPDRWGGLIDLPSVLDQRVIGRLCAVLGAVNDEDHVAVRSCGVYGRRLVPVARGDQSQAPWCPLGTVLITGGNRGGW